MLRFALLIAVLFAPLSFAQQSDRGPTIRLLAERVPKDLGQVVLVAGDAEGEAFDLPINHVTNPLPVPARVFGIKPVGGKALLTNVTLPESGRAFIVLLIPSTSGGYKPVVVPADDPTFKAGDVYFYNHADKTVIGYVGSSTFSLTPGSGRTLRPAGAKENTYYDVGFGVREKEGDRTLSTTRWPVENKIRSYVFFFSNPTTKRVDFRAVDEFIDPENP
jgi:hypothetical protein